MGVDVYERSRRGGGGARKKGPPNTVQGVREVVGTLRLLRQVETLETISYRATFGAAKELAAVAQQMANYRTLSTDNPGGGKRKSGALSKAFAIKRIRDGTKRGYTVGVRAGRLQKRFAGTARDPWYWWLLEFGTVHIAPIGFFRDAITTMSQSWVPTIRTSGLKAVMRSANAALKKMGG